MVLIERLNKLLEEASILPASFWMHKYYLSQRVLKQELNLILKSIEKESESRSRVEAFRELISKRVVSELELATGLQAIAEIFVQSKSEEDEARRFIDLTDKFVIRAKNEEKFKKLRMSVAQKMDEKQRQAYDLKLFQNEGTGYFLEYYLAFYHALSKTRGDKRKKDFLGAKEVNLGFGNLPGLRQDLIYDESLNKFVLLVLDDRTREDLLYYYCDLKILVLGTDGSLIVQRKLQDFIYGILLVFEEKGIKTLTSRFFEPYGKNPKVIKLVKKFSI